MSAFHQGLIKPHRPAHQTSVHAPNQIHAGVKGYLISNSSSCHHRSFPSYLRSSITLSPLLRLFSELLFLELVGLLSDCSLLEFGRCSRCSVLLLEEFGRRSGVAVPPSMGSSSSSIIRPSLSTFVSRSRRVSRPRLWQYQNTKRRTVSNISMVRKKEEAITYRKVLS
jgi:hypothetical protein